MMAEAASTIDEEDPVSLFSPSADRDFGGFRDSLEELRSRMLEDGPSISHEVCEEEEVEEEEKEEEEEEEEEKEEEEEEEVVGGRELPAVEVSDFTGCGFVRPFGAGVLSDFKFKLSAGAPTPAGLTVGAPVVVCADENFCWSPAAIFCCSWKWPCFSRGSTSPCAGCSCWGALDKELGFFTATSPFANEPAGVGVATADDIPARSGTGPSF